MEQIDFGAVYLVTLKNVTPLNFPSQKSKRELLKTSLVNSVKLPPPNRQRAYRAVKF